MASTLKVNTIQHTGGTTGMTIDSTGRILTPARPSFMARRTSQNAAGVVVFDTAVVNQGGHYNTSNGRITEPVDGSYQFNFYSILQGNYTNAYIQLYVSGLRIKGGDYHFSYNMGSVWHTVSYSQVVSLSANDYVEIYSYTGTGSGNVVWHGNNWGSWSGYLLG